MKYCQAGLQSRHQLQALRYKIEELRDILYEIAEIDRPLRSLDATQAVGDLRKFAYPLFLEDLERDLKKAVSE